VLSKGVDKGLTLSQVFYLATMGGAEVLDLDHKIGNFAAGKDFDAAWISSEPLSAMTMREEDDSLKTIFEKTIVT
jgi:guanine deaminase